MFVFSVKTSYKQILSVFGCCAVLAVAMVISVVWPDNAVATSVVQVSDSTARIEYLRSHGYDVVDGGEEVREVRIPEELDAVLDQYETALQAAGLSLKPYRGKRVRLYTYQVTSAEHAQPIEARLYVYRDRVIAGDVGGNVL